MNWDAWRNAQHEAGPDDDDRLAGRRPTVPDFPTAEQGPFIERTAPWSWSACDWEDDGEGGPAFPVEIASGLYEDQARALAFGPALSREADEVALGLRVLADALESGGECPDPAAALRALAGRLSAAAGRLKIKGE